MDQTDNIKTLVDMISNSERDEASIFVDKWISSYGVNGLLVNLLEPTLRLIGNMWSAQEFSLAQIYIASKISEDSLQKYTSSKEANKKDIFTKGPVVIGNIEDDYHPLGRKIVTTILQANMWKVYDLGIDVEAKSFVDTAIEVEAKIIGTSAMIYTTAENILTVREEIDKRGYSGKIQLAVGGAVFRLTPNLYKELGGDGTANNAIDVPELFNNLLDKANNFTGVPNE